MTADEVLSAVVDLVFDVRKQTLLPNSLWHDHTTEKDLLVLGAGAKPKLTEVEIKVSLADWRRDACKVTNRYRHDNGGFRYVRKYESITNQSYLSGMLSRFYIACPRSLWEVAKDKLDDQALPPWAGVIAVGDPGVAGQTLAEGGRGQHPYVETVREAKTFDARPVTEGARAEFHRLCYFRFWSLQRERQRLSSLARGLSEASADYQAAVADAWAEVARERELRLEGEGAKEGVDAVGAPV